MRYGESTWVVTKPTAGDQKWLLTVGFVLFAELGRVLDPTRWSCKSRTAWT